MFEPVRTCIEPEPCLNLAEPNMNIMSSSCSQIFKKFGHVHVQVREKVPEPDLNRTSATLTTQSCVSTDLPEKLPVNVLAH